MAAEMMMVLLLLLMPLLLLMIIPVAEGLQAVTRSCFQRQRRLQQFHGARCSQTDSALRRRTEPKCKQRSVLPLQRTLVTFAVRIRHQR